MKKILLLILVAVIIAGVVVGASTLLTEKKPEQKTGMKIETAEDMKNLVEKIYEKSKLDMPALETRELDKDDEAMLTMYTGLQSNQNIDKVIVSESMITSTAYSLAMVKVTDGADVESIKKEMVDNVDMRRWICVSADILYATDYDNVIFMVMSNEEDAKPQYDAFKELVGGTTGKELTRKFEINFDF